MGHKIIVCSDSPLSYSRQPCNHLNLQRASVLACKGDHSNDLSCPCYHTVAYHHGILVFLVSA